MNKEINAKLGTFMNFIFPVVVFLIFVALALFAVNITRNALLNIISYPEIECQEYVGSAYVYDDGQCYRLLDDGTLQPVNASLEKKIEKAEERTR